MRSGIPWSVKGIEPEAREAAKQAARRAGMTLGTWLNQVIMETGTDEVWRDADGQDGGNDLGHHQPQGQMHGTAHRPSHGTAPGQMDMPPPQAAYQQNPAYAQTRPVQQHPGAQPQVDLSPVADAVRQVLTRVEQSDRRTMDLTQRLEQSVAELSHRLDRNERGSSGDREPQETMQSFNPLERKLQQLSERLEENERNRQSFGRRSDDKTQIQALEKAMTSVVDHLDNAEKRTEDSLAEIRKTLGHVVSRVEEQRMEEEREESRSKAKALEQHLESFAGRLEKMEQSVGTVGGQAVEAALKAFSEKADAEQHKATIAALQQGLAETSHRLERIESRHEETLKNFEGLISGIAKRMEELDKLKAIDARTDELTNRLARTDDMTLKTAQAVERAIADMGDNLHKSEGRSREIASAIQTTIERITKRLAKIEKDARQMPNLMGGGFVPQTQPFPMPGFDMPSMVTPQNGFSPMGGAAGGMAASVPNEPARSPSFNEPAFREVAFPDSMASAMPIAEPFSASAPFLREMEPPPMAEENAANSFNTTGVFDTSSLQEPELDEDVLGAADADISNPTQETAAMANDFLAAARRAAQSAAQNGRHAPPLLGAASYEPQGYGDTRKESRFNKKKMLVGASLLVLFAVLGMAAVRLINSEPVKIEQASMATDVPGDMEASTQTSTQTAKPEQTAVAVPQQRETKAAETAPAEAESPYVPAQQKQASKPVRNETMTAPPSEEGPTLTPAPAKPVTTAPLQNSASKAGVASLQQSATAGNAIAQYQLAQSYANGEGVGADLKQAAVWYGKAADQGLAVAEYRLATLYEKGRGVQQNNAKARDLYEKAAAQGNVKAMHNLAVIHAEGRGVTQDFATAAKWFGMAASYGLTDSQYNLAILMQRGLGLPQNAQEAFKWFSIAASAGDKGAVQKRDEMAANMDPANAAKAKAAAKIWTPKASDPSVNGNFSGGEQTGSLAKPLSDNSLGDISRAQSMLAKLGYDVGTASGETDAKTRAAILAYQRKASLAATGSVNPALLKSLEIATR